MEQLLGVLAMFIGAGAVVAAFMALGTWLGPKRPNPEKAKIFECGNIPIAPSTERFSVKFYTTAILFVLFDIEIIFLFPWAVVFRKLGLLGLVEMGLFIAVLVMGLAYAWRKGALEWD
jgi:NADH-quinone oxidoreductase subunit A